MVKGVLIILERVSSSSEFFDILDKIGNGKFVTIGYVTRANLDAPTVSRINLATNRMKKYPDYTVFVGEEEIRALAKITSYNMMYLNRTTVGQKYGFNPKDYKIVTSKFLLRQGIDHNDNNNWANS